VYHSDLLDVLLESYKGKLVPDVTASSPLPPHKEQ